MLRLSKSLSVGLAVCLAAVPFGFVLGAAPEARSPASDARASRLHWYDDYAAAMDIARREERMLLLCFFAPGGDTACETFERETLGAASLEAKLSQVVRVKLPTDAVITVHGERITLLRHAAFAEMLGRPGLAMIDFVSKDSPNYGRVVSAFPLQGGKPYTVEQVSVMLDLPPGSLTQRTMIYAVRTHPDHPASTEGRFDPYLAEEAESQSRYQAQICLQGHHFWNRRFQRINRRLPPGCLASEVCAESWPDESLVEAAEDCVNCWRLSSGHWSAVRARHAVYAYDMKRGRNRIWYATGIFGRR